MTLKELSSEICALGFDDYLKLDATVVFAARRALLALYSELRITSRATIPVASKALSRKIAKFHHKGGGEETLPLSGKAYAMTVSGKGKVKIQDGPTVKTVTFDSDSKLIKGFLKYNNAKIVLIGNCSFDVFNLTSYSEVFGDDFSSIPDGDGFVRLNVRERLPDFLAFSSPALDASGSPIKAATLDSGIITLPADYDGEISIIYRRMPTYPTLSSPDAEIDIPREYDVLLPLLTAFYILLDEDGEKAEIYRRSYLEMLDSVKKAAYSLSNTGYVDVNGWGK